VATLGLYYYLLSHFSNNIVCKEHSDFSIDCTWVEESQDLTELYHVMPTYCRIITWGLEVLVNLVQQLYLAHLIFIPIS